MLSAVARSMIVRALFRLADRSASGMSANVPFRCEFPWPLGVEKAASLCKTFLGVDVSSAILTLFLLPLGRPRLGLEGVSASLLVSSIFSSIPASEDP